MSTDSLSTLANSVASTYGISPSGFQQYIGGMQIDTSNDSNTLAALNDAAQQYQSQNGSSAGGFSDFLANGANDAMTGTITQPTDSGSTQNLGTTIQKAGNGGFTGWLNSGINNVVAVVVGLLMIGVGMWRLAN